MKETSPSPSALDLIALTAVAIIVFGILLLVVSCKTAGSVPIDAHYRRALDECSTAGGELITVDDDGAYACFSIPNVFSHLGTGDE